MKLSVAKPIALLSRGIFLYLPSVYLKVYSIYKRKADRHKLFLMKKYIQPGAVHLDIGAHIGFYSLAVAKWLGYDSGEIFAFEPSPENFRILQQNVKGHKNIHSYPLAVGEHDRQIDLHISPFLNVDHRTYPAPEENRRTIQVSQVSLDNFFSKEDKKISFIKMDIQGYEYQALLGMKNILRSHRPKVLMEFWPWGLRSAGTTAGTVLDFLKLLDYQIMQIDEATVSLKRLDPKLLGEGQDDYYDLFCSPEN